MLCNIWTYLSFSLKGGIEGGSSHNCNSYLVLLIESKGGDDIDACNDAYGKNYRSNIG